ncbi:SUN domain-containing protein 5 [Bienertia sinuspersici]
MWVQEEGCGDIVREAWDNNTVVDPIQALKMKHTKCAEKLRRWNGETFGNVSRKIKEAEGKLKGTSDASMRRKVMREIRELRRREERATEREK